MKIEAKIIISSTLAILLFGAVSSAMIKNSSPALPSEEYGSYACTTDAKLCPSGAYVGRIPPYCQFAPCPK